MLSGALLTLGLHAPAAQADTASYDKIWDYAHLYENPNGNYLSLSGRLQVDAASFSAGQGSYDDMLWRRFRFGFVGQYRHTAFQLEGDFNLNNEDDNGYNRLTDAYLKWKLPNQLDLKVLKHSAGFTLDGKTSSKKLLTPQRNNLTNNLWFTAEYFSGASVSGPVNDDWSINAGLFSSDDSDEIGLTEASYFGLFSVGRKLSPGNFWQQGEVRLDYVYNDSDQAQNTRDFSQVVSLSSQFQFKQWGLATDLAAGNGDLGQKDIWGLVIMPSYRQTDITQWVMRYSYLDSKGQGGLRLHRYEREIVGGRGDRYNELYAGATFFLYGHKAKINVGVQYTHMEDSKNAGGDYEGVGVTLALRTYW
nr:porin [Aestuariicella hydrocarbonica]